MILTEETDIQIWEWIWQISISHGECVEKIQEASMKIMFGSGV